MRAPALHLRFSDDASQESRDVIAAALLDFDTAAVHEISDTEWRVFFRAAVERDRAATLLAASCAVSPIDIEDEDWARRSQQDLKAVRVGSLVITPPWDIRVVSGQWPVIGEQAGVVADPCEEPRRPPLTSDRRPLATGHPHVIVIEPSTGFGTGHHATTRLCLRALQRIDLRGKRVLDVGTGSGVLAIAAARLGSASVIAVDHDPDALAAARDNVGRNAAAVELRLVDLERDRLDPADVVIANLTGAMLQRAADTLARLARGGVLIVSGLLEEEVAAVSNAFVPYASDIGCDHESGWGALTLTIP